jgi:hypothetical protein
MILWLPWAALTGAVLADAARQGLHKKITTPGRRGSAISYLRAVADSHGRRHNLSVVRVRVDLDAYVKAIELYAITYTKQVTMEEEAARLEEVLLTQGNFEGARKAQELQAKLKVQRRLLGELAQSVAYHKAWLRDED